jgi:hypothetical protein
MITAFFLTPLEIIGAFAGGVLALLGISAKTNKRNPPKGKRKKGKK